MLVTVSKGSSYVSACIDLLSALVRQVGTLIALEIMLELEGAMKEV